MPDPLEDPAAPAAAARGRRVVILVGMHRSGTSCLAGSLQQAGLHLGDVQESNPHNRKGNRENLRIMRLNDAVLGNTGGRWDAPPDTIAWNEADAAERDDLVDSLEREAPRLWGFKDPRTLLTLEFWRERLPGARLVGSFRHPGQVARSLHARSGFDPKVAFELWCAYNERLLREHARARFPLVSFDQAPADYLRSVEAVVRSLGLPAATAAAAHFEESLRSVADAGAFAAPAEALRLYEALDRAAVHAG